MANVIFNRTREVRFGSIRENIYFIYNNRLYAILDWEDWRVYDFENNRMYDWCELDDNNGDTMVTPIEFNQVTITVNLS